MPYKVPTLAEQLYLMWLQKQPGAPLIPPPQMSTGPQMQNQRPMTPMDLGTLQPLPTQQMPMTGAIPRAATAGVKQFLGGTAEMLPVNPQMEQWGRDLREEGQLASQQAHLGDQNRGFLQKGMIGLTENVPQMLPQLAGGAMGGGLGYMLGALPSAGYIYGGAEGDESTRRTSAATQAGIEAVDPTGFLLNSPLPWYLKIPAIYGTSVFSETGQEGVQKLVADKIERDIPFSQQPGTRAVEEMKAALPTTALMGLLPAAGGVGPNASRETPGQQELPLEGGKQPPKLKLKTDVVAPVVSNRHNGTRGSEKGTGSSTNVFNGTAPKTGFAVGVRPDRTRVINGDEVTKKEAEAFLAQNWDVFQNDPGLVFGTWYNRQDGKTYLDATAIIPDLDTAMKIARQNNEIAIWDLAKGEEILTDYGTPPEQLKLFGAGPMAVEQDPNWAPYKQPGTDAVGARSVVPGGHDVRIYPAREGWRMEGPGWTSPRKYANEAEAKAAAEAFISRLPVPKPQPTTSGPVATPPAPAAVAPRPVTPPPAPRPMAPSPVDMTDPRAQMIASAASRVQPPVGQDYNLPAPVAEKLKPLQMNLRDYPFPVWDFQRRDNPLTLPKEEDALGGNTGDESRRDVQTVVSLAATVSPDPDAMPHGAAWLKSMSRLKADDPQYLNVLLSRAVSAYYGDKQALTMLEMAAANEGPETLPLVNHIRSITKGSAYQRGVYDQTNRKDADQQPLFPFSEVPPIGQGERGRNDPAIDQTYQAGRDMAARDQMRSRQGQLPLGAIPEGATEQDNLNHLFGLTQEEINQRYGKERPQPVDWDSLANGVAFQPGARQYLKTDRAPFAKILAAPETEQRLIELADKGKDVGAGWWDASGVSKDYGHEWPVFAKMWAAANQMNAPDTAFKIASMHFQDYKAWKAAGADPANIEQFFRPTPLPGYGSVAQKDIRRNAMQIATGQGMNPTEEKLTSMAANAMGDMDPATIDRWIVRALYGPTDWSTMTNAEGKKVPESLSREQYGSAEQLIQKAAATAGMTPADFQASVWVGAMRKALESGWRGARGTSLAGTNDQYQTRVEKTAAELGMTEEEVRRKAAAGEIVLRQPTAPLDGIVGNPAPMPDLPEAALVPPEPGPQMELPVEMPPVEKRSYPMRDANGNLVLAAQEAPTALRVKPGGRNWLKLPITHPQQMASTARYLEDETVEHMIFAYTKNGRVVDVDMLTDNDVNSVQMRAGLDFVGENLRSLGADKVFVLHNHPSGIAQFSGEDRPGGDVSVAAELKRQLGDKLAGFSIVAGDTGRASHLDVNLQRGKAERVTNKFSWERQGERRRLKGFIESPLIGEVIAGSEDVTRIVRGVEQQYGPLKGMNGGLLMFRDGNGRLIGLETADPEQIADPKYVKAREAEHGGKSLAYAGTDDVLRSIQTKAGPGTFLDVLDPSGQSASGMGFQVGQGSLPKQMSLEIEQGDTVPYNAGQVPTLEQKAGQAVAGDSRELTDWATALAETTKEDWELAKGGVIPHSDSLNAGIELGKKVGFNADEVKALLADQGGNPVLATQALAAAAITSRVNMSRAIRATSVEEFAQRLSDAANMLILARTQASSAGRTLGFWGDLIKGGSPEKIVKAADDSKTLVDNLLKGKDSMTPQNVIDRLGGADNVETLWKTMQYAEMNGTLDLENVSRAFNAMMNYGLRQKERGTLRRIADMPLEQFRAFILTGPATHEVNVLSTMVNMAMHKALVEPIAAGINKITRAGDQPSMRDQLRGTRSVLRGLSDVWALTKFGAKVEYPGAQMEQMVQANPFQQQAMLELGEDKWRSEMMPALPGAYGRVVRSAGFAPLSAEDAALRGVVLRAEVASLMSMRGEEWDGISTVPADVMAEAMELADKLTFNNRLGKLATSINSAIRGTYVGSWVVPFVRTMSNIIKTGVAYTPPMNLLVAEEREALMTPHSRAQNEALARVVVGSSLWGLVAMLRDTGDDGEEDPNRILTAPSPKNYMRRNIYELENGNIAIKLPDGTQKEIYRMEPLNIVLGSMIAGVDAMNLKEKGWEEKMSIAATNMAKVPLNAHFLMSVSDMVDAFGSSNETEDPLQGKRMQQWMTRTGAAMTIPQFGAQAAQFMDPVQRKPALTLEDQLKMRLPGLRETLPERLDVRGQVKPEQRFGALLPAIPTREPRPADPLAQELLRWGKGMGYPRSINEMPVEKQKAVLQHRWKTLTDWMPYESEEEFNRAQQSYNARKQVREMKAAGVAPEEPLAPPKWREPEEKAAPKKEAAPKATVEEALAKQKPKRVAKPKPPKPTFEQKLDIAGGSADQRKDPLTKTLSRAKVGLNVPTWTKQLDEAERDEILTDRWTMMQEAVADLPEDADVKEVQTRIAKAKAKWSRKWKNRRDELKAQGE